MVHDVRVVDFLEDCITPHCPQIPFPLPSYSLSSRCTFRPPVTPPSAAAQKDSNCHEGSSWRQNQLRQHRLIIEDAELPHTRLAACSAAL